ncbi:hypothetical protein FRC02_000767 [Tulasnella sp. 418]|nr:hypothetical protein FRC02_000767 [Tulasnella sp. 418]
MPRRSAPTALRLRQGPISRGEPKHQLPLPPLPTFYPTSLSSSTARAKPKLTIQPSYSMADPTNLSNVLDASIGLQAQSRSPSPSSSPVDQPTRLRGPWDRSGGPSFTESLSRSSLIAPPKPVASFPILNRLI